MTKGFGFAGSLSYISDMMKKLEKIQLTIHEWNEAMRMPTPIVTKRNITEKKSTKMLGNLKNSSYIYKVR
jgi:hypothetical protein